MIGDRAGRRPWPCCGTASGVAGFNGIKSRCLWFCLFVGCLFLLLPIVR